MMQFHGVFVPSLGVLARMRPHEPQEKEFHVIVHGFEVWVDLHSEPVKTIYKPLTLSKEGNFIYADEHEMFVGIEAD